MAGAVQVFKDNMIEADRLRAEQAQSEARAAAQRRADMHELAGRFESAIGEIIETLGSSSTELEAAAGTLSRTADSTQELSTIVAAASEEASANVQSVASASEEMSASVAAVKLLARHALTEPDRRADGRHEHDRHQPQRRAQEAHDAAHHEREAEVQHRTRRDAGTADRDLAVSCAGHRGVDRLDERARRDVGERDDHVEQREPDVDREDGVAAAVEVLPQDLRDGARAVAHRRDERTEVVHRADEDAAEHDPPERRLPAEHLCREDRADDRSGGADRREVLRQQVEALGRFEVLAVAVRVRGGRRGRVEPEPPREQAAVDPVRERERGEGEAQVTTEECQFCHSQGAPKPVEDAIKANGFFIQKMEGCP